MGISLPSPQPALFYGRKNKNKVFTLIGGNKCNI
ncbi:hypothetical protein PTD2_14522 [Pseudoalteromonas tunicata D2]|uniref:Uncharacterized protein n=1 Tax=Pseudoalteromonas tunicata D2 TaxID=87626 RepID=A4CCG9_9GAMM|nr:hypothetical protein PTD2_14522 [Pseudoalteromonas tunicata D2]